MKHGIFAENMSDYKNIKKNIAKVEAEYYSFTCKSERVQSMLLKGMDPSTKTEEILEELKSYNEAEREFSRVKIFETRGTS